MKLEISQQFFEKYLDIKFHENLSSGSRVVSGEQTDGLTDMTKLIVAFRKFANAPKNGDQLELNNYGGIAVLNTGYKILSNILYECLQPYKENIVGKFQCGFKKDDSTMDQIQSTRQILEKTSECGISTLLCSLTLWLPVTP